MDLRSARPAAAADDAATDVESFVAVPVRHGQHESRLLRRTQSGRHEETSPTGQCVTCTCRLDALTLY